MASPRWLWHVTVLPDPSPPDPRRSFVSERDGRAAIGLGMANYTHYTRVLDADGTPVRVRDALMPINQVLDEVLVEQESDFDTEARRAPA